MARAHPEAVLVVSGGAVSGPVEAEVMQRWLASRGVDASRIICEPAARSTAENAAFVAPLLHELDVVRVTLVTERFHMRRSRLLLRRELARVGLYAPLEIAAAEDELGVAGRALWAAREMVKLWLYRR